MSKRYEDINCSIKEIRTREDLFAMVDQLKANKLYDDSHPYFVTDSPFYLANAQHDSLELPSTAEFSEEGLSFYEIN